MVAVIAAMRREIESDRQPHLPRWEIVAVKAVRLLGRREPSVLADRPGPVGVHRRPWPAQIGRETWHQAAQLYAGVFNGFEVRGGVERLDRDALRRRPVEALEGFAF